MASLDPHDDVYEIWKVYTHGKQYDILNTQKDLFRPAK